MKKIKETYKIIKQEIKIISGNNNSIEKELSKDIIRRGNRSSN